MDRQYLYEPFWLYQGGNEKGKAGSQHQGKRTQQVKNPVAPAFYVKPFVNQAVGLIYLSRKTLAQVGRVKEVVLILSCL